MDSCLSGRACVEEADRGSHGQGQGRAIQYSGAPGRIMFEVDGVPESLAREAFDLAAAKLPIKTRFVQRIAE